MGKITHVGVVGAGVIAHEHAEAIGNLPRDFSLIAVADLDRARADEFARQHGLESAYATAAAMMGEVDLDLVVVATPPCFHEEVVSDALRRGKYVLCEKPLAHTLEAAQRLRDLANEFPNRLTVGYQQRYSPERERFRWICQNGGVGEVRFAKVARHGQIPRMHQGEGGWWGKWRVAGGGVALTQMIHEFDLLLAIMGRPLAIIARLGTKFTSIESEDIFEAEIEFKNGGIAQCSGSVNSGWIGGEFSIFGTLGSVALGKNEVAGDRVLNKKIQREVNRALPHTKAPTSRLVGRIFRAVRKRMGGMEDFSHSAHVEYYRRLRFAIARDGAMPVPAEESMHALELCMAIYESAIIGERVELPLSQKSRVYAGISPKEYSSAALTPGMKTGLEPVLGKETIRVGLVGLDSSHAPMFSRILNDPNDPEHIAGATVVAGFPGGSDDMKISCSRVKGFTNKLRDFYKVAIIDDPIEVARRSDVVFILAVDGRTHLKLFEQIAPVGKPTFVDKPFCVSLPEAKRMYEVADMFGVRLFASSVYRYADELVRLLNGIRNRSERILDCEVATWIGVFPEEEQTQGRYFWYGIHAIEILVAVLGVGATRIMAEGDNRSDMIQVAYGDGRQGRIRVSRSDSSCKVAIGTSAGKYRLDLTTDVPSFTGRALEAVLDVLAGDDAVRLWKATNAGSICWPRLSRAIDPERGETLEVVRILDGAQQSFLKGDWVALIGDAETAVC